MILLEAILPNLIQNVNYCNVRLVLIYALPFPSCGRGLRWGSLSVFLLIYLYRRLANKSRVAGRREDELSTDPSKLFN